MNSSKHQKLYQCGICDKKFSRKLNKKLHLITCSANIGAQNISYRPAINLKLVPRKGKSAFRAIIVEWTIHYPDDYSSINPIVLLKKSTMAMKDIMRMDTTRLKYSMSLHVVLEKASDSKVKTPVVLTTRSPTCVYLGTDIDRCLENTADELLELLEEYKDWTIDYLYRLDTRVNRAYDSRGTF